MRVHHSKTESLNTAVRKLSSEYITRGTQTLELLSIEADYIDDVRITPANWEAYATETIERADVVFVEYFPPELEQNIAQLHELGEYSRKITDTYGRIADIAHAANKPVAVADIANRPLFEIYQMGLYPSLGATAVACARRGGIAGMAGTILSEAYIAGGVYQALRNVGVHSPTTSTIERYTPNATDARRTLTARAIAQTAQALPPDTSLAYIAAPAHVNRVKAMLTKPKTAADSAKAVAYKHLIGLDRSIRIYKPTDNGWERVANEPIR